MLLFQRENSQGAYALELREYLDFSFAPHLHSHLELCYVCDGAARLVVDGKALPMEAGEAALVLPNQIHAYLGGQSGRIWVCVFSGDFVPDFVAALRGREIVPPTFRPSAGLVAFLNALREGRSLTPYAQKSGLYALCDETLRDAATIPRKQAEAEAVQRTLRYLELHAPENLTLASVAQALGYSRYHLSRQFHSLTHLGFRTVLNGYRVEQARRMLRQTDQPITEIALACGFQNPRSFNRAFREAMGMTPRTYRDGRP